ncbi:hypothetical protein TNIN_255511 [Trichonephila inaurata madagascariensis]|uniref:Uncharacterized protein n=1 Tax=Trichonephila inaurata madagascariensis TaxID=2747483 RepID=A0A8X6MBW7_9ARAC|nr:hypothetical protein TNIN_255511 [Trichonephila inaurata madagascariensis]
MEYKHAPRLIDSTTSLQFWRKCHKYLGFRLKAQAKFAINLKNLKQKCMEFVKNSMHNTSTPVDGRIWSIAIGCLHQPRKLDHSAILFWSENANQPVVRKLISEVLTESERKTAMRGKARKRLEKAVKVKTNNKKPSEKQKKKRRVSLPSSNEEIPLDTSGDSFD